MGFTFRKSLRLPGGFRLNLSKSGVGASWGVPGIRIGTGPRGPRVSAYIPGTGIGWTSSLGGERKSDTQPAAPSRDLARMEDRERAAAAVAAFEEQIARLTSLHKEGSRPLDWRTIEAAPAPAASTASDPTELARWQWWTRLAHGINTGDLDAYEAAIEHLSPLRALPALGSPVEASAPETWLAEARFVASPPDVVPAEALSLTPTGKLSRKKLGVQKAREMYQDHVSSAVFRVARELFALLPVDLVLVHARTRVLDKATGHFQDQTILSAAFPREDMGRIDLDHIDPSDALERFPHAMEFSTRTGFSPVDEIGVSDLIDASQQAT